MVLQFVSSNGFGPRLPPIDDGRLPIQIAKPKQLNENHIPKILLSNENAKLQLLQ